MQLSKEELKKLEDTLSFTTGETGTPRAGVMIQNYDSKYYKPTGKYAEQKQLLQAAVELHNEKERRKDCNNKQLINGAMLPTQRTPTGNTMTEKEVQELGKVLGL